MLMLTLAGTLVAAEPEAFVSESPLPPRYFSMPSAFPMPKGQGFISKEEVLLTTIGYGFGDHVSASVTMSYLVNLLELGGSCSGLGCAVGSFSHVIVTTRAGWELDDDLAAGGSLVIVGIEELGTATALGSVSRALPGRSLTVSSGISTFLRYGGVSVPLIVAGHRSVGPRLDLVGECWLLGSMSGDSLFFDALVAGGGRIPLRRAELDLALATTFIATVSGYDVIPVPWVDVTWPFGS